MNCFLIPKALVINLFTGSSGDTVSLRACSRVGGTAPGAELARGAGGFLQPGAGDEAGAGSGTEAAVSLGGQMDKFWGAALQKQSVWRGDGGMEPNLTTCSILQGQRDASPCSEQRHGAKASIHSLHPLAPQFTSTPTHLGSLGL